MRRKKTEADDLTEKKDQLSDDDKIEIKINSSETDEDSASNEAASAKEEEAEPTASEEKVEAAEETPEEPPESESERYIRLAAEFDNYKKRTAREFGEMIRTANSRLLKSLIDILDNFERALDGNADTDDLKAYRQGVELIYNQLNDLLKRENITSIEALGQPFDPNFHEAMLQQESDEYDEGVVCAELQKGYKIGDKVLRHARVMVSSGAKKTDDENKSSD